MNEALIKGITLGLLLSIAVGPILFTIIKQSINNGVRGGLAFVLGVSLSEVCLAVASNFFTELAKSFLQQSDIVAIIGSILFISAGVYFLFFKKIAFNEDGKQTMIFRKRDYARLFFTGLLMNILNPFIVAFWLATATTFAGHTLRQRFFIFSVALILVLIADILKVLGANKIRKRLTLKNILLINRINGLILIGFGVILLFIQIFYGDKLAS